MDNCLFTTFYNNILNIGNTDIGLYTASHVIMQVNFFDITFTLANDNSFIFVHILTIPAYCTILKGICSKVNKL